MLRKNRLIQSFLSNKFFKERYDSAQFEYLQEAKDFPSSNPELATLLFLVDLLEDDPDISDDNAYKRVGVFFTDSAI